MAGERVRASNAIYGAAKAGLDGLVQGLADSVAGSGVRVLVVRPGFVTTRMTAGLEPAPMSTTADAVALATLAALEGRAHTIWVPGKLRSCSPSCATCPAGCFAGYRCERQRALLIDAAVAVLFAVIVLIVSPGLAITAILAVVLLLAFGVAGLVRRRRLRRDRGPARVRTASRRPPPAAGSRGPAGRRDARSARSARGGRDRRTRP